MRNQVKILIVSMMVASAGIYYYVHTRQDLVNHGLSAANVARRTTRSVDPDVSIVGSPQEDESKVVSPQEEYAAHIRMIMALPLDDPRRKDFILNNKVQQLPDIIQKEDAVLFQKLALGDDEKNLLVNLLVLRHLMQTEALADIIKTEVDVHATLPPDSPGGNPITISFVSNVGDISGMGAKLDEVNSFVDEKVSNLLGADGFAIYSNFMSTEPYRSEANGVPQISNDQEEQLLNVLQAANTPQRFYVATQITDGVIQAARSFLTQSQVDYLLEEQRMTTQMDNAVKVAMKEKKYTAHK